MKKSKVFLLVVMGLMLASCAGSPLGSLISKHPSMEDVDAMIIGKTTQEEVNKKFSGHRETRVQNMKCQTYFKPSMIGEGSKTTFLCFENGVLKQKYFQ